MNWTNVFYTFNTIYYIPVLLAAVKTSATTSATHKCCPSDKILLYNNLMKTQHRINCELITTIQKNHSKYIYYTNSSRYRIKAPFKMNDPIQVNHSIRSNVSCYDLAYRPGAKHELQFSGVVHKNYTYKLVPKKNKYFFRLNTCCDADKTFNYTTRQCELNNNKNLTMLLNLFRNNYTYLEIEQRNVVCESVMVDHLVPRSNIHLEGKKRQIRLGSIVVSLLKHKNPFCLEQSNQPSYFVVRVCMDKSYCNNNKCLSKCNEFDEYYQAMGNNIFKILNGTRSLHNSLMMDNSTKFNELKKNILMSPEYGLKTSMLSCSTMYSHTGNWHMTPRGYVQDEIQLYDYDHFCLETVTNSWQNKHNIFLYVCVELVHPTAMYLQYIKPILSISSCICLAFTLVYVKTSVRVQTVYSKLLFQLCICYFFTFFTSIFISMNVVQKTRICPIWGYLTVFFAISVFTWLNLLSFTIWNTIRNTFKLITESHSCFQVNAFNFCYLYAWGIPTVCTVISMCLDFTNLLPNYYKPNMDVYTCTFRRLDNIGKLMYFTIPISIMFSFNIVFFILTVIDYNKIMKQLKEALKNQTSDDQYSRFNKQIVTNFKLFFLMGIPLINDIIMSILWQFSTNIFDYEISKIFFVTAVLNHSQGLFMSFIIIWRCDNFKQFKTYWREHFQKWKLFCTNPNVYTKEWRIQFRKQNTSLECT